MRLFQRALGSFGAVFTADMSPLSAAGGLGDGHHLVPHSEDPAFIPAIAELCAALNVTHVVPTIDTELPIYSARRELLAQAGITVWVSSPEAIDIARDKRLTNQFLAGQGLPRPEQVELEAARAGVLRFPVIAKPARGSSSVGLIRATDVVDLRSLDTKLDYIVEETLPGVEYTVDCLVNSSGVCVAAVPRRRLEVRAGEVSKGWIHRNEAVERVARAVATALPGAFGVLNVQVFHDRETGRTAVIEINARFGGGFPLTFAAGADFPGWMLRHLSGEDLPAPGFEDDLVMLRYDQGVYLRASDLGLTP